MNPNEIIRESITAVPFLIFGIASAFFNPIMSITCFVSFSTRIAIVIDNIYRPIEEPIIRQETDEDLISKMDKVDFFTYKTNHFYYLAIIDFLFTNNKGIFISNEKTIFSAITRKGHEEFLIPKSGIFYFNHFNRKIYVKIDNPGGEIFNQHFSIYLNPGMSDFYHNAVKSDILNELKSFLNQETNISIILTNYGNYWLPKFIYGKTEIPPEVKLANQRYVVDYVFKNIEKIKKNKITRFFLVGENNLGKTHTSQEVAKQLSKPLYVLKETFSRENFINIIKAIPPDAIVDISDLGWFFYDPTTIKKIENASATIDDVKLLIFDRKDILTFFSTNKTFNFFFKNTGLSNLMHFQMDFDCEL